MPNPQDLIHALGLAAALLTALTLVGGWLLSVPPHSGPESDHFDGRRFSNPHPFHRPLSPRVIRCLLRRDRGRWDRWREIPAFPRPPAQVHGEQLRCTLVNHATVLLQTAGLNILTDPIWSDRCTPFWISGHRRRKPPGVAFEDLPPIDVVVISHNHYDHLDLPTVRRLHEAHRPHFVVPLGNAASLIALGIADVTELDWWEAVEADPEVRIRCVPAQHYSGRGLFDHARALWAGFVVEAPGGPTFFAGDSGYAPHFREIRQRCGAMRLALLPIGAFTPRWFMKPVHTSPEETVRIHRELDASCSVAIHHSTFPLGDDAQDQPAQELERVRAAAGLDPEDFRVLENGEAVVLPAS